MANLKTRWETEELLLRAEAFHEYTMDDLGTRHRRHPWRFRSMIVVSDALPICYPVLIGEKAAGLRGMKDPALLELAAQQGRILISHDRETMTRHYFERPEAGKSAPSLFIVPQRPSAVGAIIESLLFGVGGVASGRMAESDRPPALAVNGRVRC